MSKTTTFSSTVVKVQKAFGGGSVRMRVAGDAERTNATFLALPGLGRVGNADWERVITAGDFTTKANVRALLPDPTSNVMTSPSVFEFAVVRTCTTLGGALQYPCREDWLLDVLSTRHHHSAAVDEDKDHAGGGGDGDLEGRGSKDSGGSNGVGSGGGGVVLAGHSWGGGAAARFAVAHPELVSKLILVSPDVERSVARQLKVPTLLIWSRDDMINLFLWTRRFRGHPSLTLHATQTGGHGLHDFHCDVVSRWLHGEDVGNTAL